MAGLRRPLRVAALQLRHIARSRAYGSAAAAQLQYDCYDDDEDYELYGKESEQMLKVDSAGSPPKRGIQWVLIGNPGLKKTVYADKLSKLLEVPHISMGTLVKQELNPRSALYEQIANAVNEGKLVPENVIFALLSKWLEEGYYIGESGFILDGIPRTSIQTEIVDQIVDVDLVMNFKCIEDQLVKKNIESEAVSPCQEFLSMGNASISTAAAARAWKENFHIYADQGKSLENYYRKQRKILDIQVGGAPGETWYWLHYIASI